MIDTQNRIYECLINGMNGREVGRRENEQHVWCVMQTVPVFLFRAQKKRFNKNFVTKKAKYSPFSTTGLSL